MDGVTASSDEASKTGRSFFTKSTLKAVDLAYVSVFRLTKGRQKESNGYSPAHNDCLMNTPSPHTIIG